MFHIASMWIHVVHDPDGGVRLVGFIISDGADAAEWDEFTIDGIVYQKTNEKDKTVRANDWDGTQ